MNTTATEAPATTRLMRDQDLLDLVWIADPQMSPDGQRVAFTRVSVDKEADDYRTTLWIAETAGGTPRPLTSGHKDRQARWSPDGKTLAFVRGAGPDDPAQIWLLPMEGGEATVLTALEKSCASPAWSPDGARLAFLSGTNVAIDRPKPEKPKHEPARIVTRPVFRENDSGFVDFDHLDHIWVIDATGGAARQITAGAFTEGAPRWSRDGRHLLFLSDRRPEPWFGDEGTVLYAVAPDLASATDGAALQVVFDPGGPIDAFAESHDGRIAAIAAQLSPDVQRSFNQRDLLIAEGAWPMRVTHTLNPDGRWSVGEGVNGDQHPPRGGGDVPLAWDSNGQSVLVRAARDGGGMLVRAAVAGGGWTALTPQRADLVNGTADARGRRWVVTLGTAMTPGDLTAVDAETGATHALWSPNAALLGAMAAPEVEEFWYPSFDGRKIQAWIVKPPGFDPGRQYPMILEIHGGPHTAYGSGFFHEFHQLASAGYVVLYTNPRGSTSYGSEFANVIQYSMGTDEAKDLLAAVEAVVAKGYIDTHKVGVTGGSYGGLMTNWLVCLSKRFAAALTQRCVSDWPNMYNSCDFAMYTPFWFEKPLDEDPATWAKRSPLSQVRNITTPLMIIHSEEDWRTPIAQGEALFRALKQLRRTVVMVRFPGESHELSRSGIPSRRVQNQKHIRAWFDHWLMGRPAPEYGV